MGTPYALRACICTRMGGRVMTRRSGRPLAMRMRMDVLMCSMTRASLPMLRRWRPVRRWGRAQVSVRILASHNMHRRTYWPSIRGSNSFANPGAFPALPGPDIVQPVAAAATAPTVFEKATGFVALLQNLMRRQKIASRCSRSKVRTLTIIRALSDTLEHSHRRWTRTQSTHSRSVRVWVMS